MKILIVDIEPEKPTGGAKPEADVLIESQALGWQEVRWQIPDQVQSRGDVKTRKTEYDGKTVDLEITFEWNVA